MTTRPFMNRMLFAAQNRARGGEPSVAELNERVASSNSKLLNLKSTTQLEAGHLSTVTSGFSLRLRAEPYY
jgi:hypothetical protein